MLTFVTYYLLKNPEKLQKLRDEIDTMIGDRPMTIDDVHKLPYLIGKYLRGIFTSLSTNFLQPSCVRRWDSHLPLLCDPSHLLRTQRWRMERMPCKRTNSSQQIYTPSTVILQSGARMWVIGIPITYVQFLNSASGRILWTRTHDGWQVWEPSCKYPSLALTT